MYDDVLVPTDGSNGIDAVLDHAFDLARRHDATVHALYVIDDRAFVTLHDSMVDEVAESLGEEGETATAAVASAAEDAGLTATTATRRGDPAEEILDYADDAGIDLISMGTRGADERRNLLGSVSRTVVTESTVPVLTVAVGED